MDIQNKIGGIFVIYTMKNKPNNEVEIKKSITDIYTQFSQQRAEERLRKQEEKDAKKIAKLEEKELEKDTIKKSKKERLLDSESAYKEILLDLTGEDIDYCAPKRKKLKFKKWLTDDDDELLVDKPKKKKKKDYRKEFGPELSVLKTLLTDQNRFTNDLLKKFNAMTKDGNMNKTSVDLAANIISSRGNALGLIKEIGSIKKTMADLYYKQLKQELDERNASGSGYSEDEIDKTIGGARIYEQMFADSNQLMDTNTVTVSNEPIPDLVPVIDVATPNVIPKSEIASNTNIQSFDPSTWDQNDLILPHTKYENIPHSLVVEWDRPNNRARFKAINDATGEELQGYPVPVVDISKLTFDIDNMTVKSEFDDVYKLIIL